MSSKPSLGIGKPIAPARGLPLIHENDQFLSHRDQSLRKLRAAQTMSDLASDSCLQIHHFGAQHTDLAPEFVNSVVHDVLRTK